MCTKSFGRADDGGQRLFRVPARPGSPKVSAPGLPERTGSGKVVHVTARTVPAGTPTGTTTRSSRSGSAKAKPHEGVFDGYNRVGGYDRAFDEMFDPQGNVRGPYKGIFAEMAPSDAS